MPIEINGSGTITGISAGGYPDGTVTAADLASTLDLSGKTVTLPSGVGGKILQVQHSVKLGSQVISNAQNNWVTVTDLGVSITPASNASKLVILYNVNAGLASTNWWSMRLVRDSTQIFGGNGEAASYPNNISGVWGEYGISNNYMHSVAGAYTDDSHSSGGTQITYNVQFRSAHSNTYVMRVNRSWDIDNGAYRTMGSSAMTVLEVAG